MENRYSKLTIVSFVLSLINILILLAGKSVVTIFNSNFFIISLLILPLVIIITSIISLVLVKKNNLKGKLFAWISLIIAIIMFIAGLLITWFPPEVIY